MKDEEVTSSKTDNSGKTDNNPLSAAYARFKFLPIPARVVGGALVGVAILGAVAYFLPNMKERMKFFTDAALSWLILVIVTVQAYIYSKQWKVMEKQARSADQSVVFGLRAYVGVHSVSDIDFDNRRFLIQFENIGKVPASHIDIKYDMEVRIPDRCTDEQTRRPPWKQAENFYWVCHWGDSRYYGRAKLFPGNLKIKKTVPLNGWLSRNQLAQIKEGNAIVFFRGNVEFSDGFNKGKNSPFAFLYSHEEHEWVVDAVITKEEIEARLRTRAGGRDLSADWRVIPTRPPGKPEKTDEKTK